MAAETGGDGLPFLGSVMSLVSHGEIRYEGILCNIDMPNSTIALSNVRCFGTEGRRTDGPDVPPNDQVFEVVVFKGGEIKELTVLQPPAPQQGFQDPAIVSAGPAPPGPPPPGPPAPPPGPPAYGAPPPPGGPSPWGPPPPGAWGNNPWGNPPPAPASVPAAGAPPPPRPSGQPAPAPAPTVAVAPAAARQQPPQPVPPHQQQQAGGQRRPPPPPPGIANGTAAANQPGTGAGASQHAPRIVPISYAHAAGGGRGGGGRGAPRGRGQSAQGAARGRGGQVGAPPGIPRPAPVPPVEVPKEEFNFEEALKRFNKEELLKEAEEKPELTSAAAADKKTAYVKDDFFDELSCEALEKLHLAESGEARPDHRTKMAAMRKQDLETFGGMARGRSAGRGYRGRGRGYHNRGGASGNGGRGQRGRGNNNRERGEGGRAPREVAAN